MDLKNMTKEKANQLLVVRAGYKIELRRLYLDVSGGNVFVGLAEIGEDVHLTEEAFWRMVEVLKPSAIRFTPRSKSEYTVASFNYELFGEQWKIFSLLKKGD